MLEDIVTAVPNNLAQAKKQKPLSLWQMFKKMFSQDTRRALSAMLGNLVARFGSEVRFNLVRCGVVVRNERKPPRRLFLCLFF